MILASASLSLPATDVRVRPSREEDFGLPTADEIRALPGGIEGVSLSLDLRTVDDATHVRATVRNDGPHAIAVAWPEPCTAGKRVFADGDILVVTRSLSLPPKVWRHMHDWEAITGWALVLAAGDVVTEDIILRSPVAECTVDTRLGTLGRRLGEVRPSTRILVAYDVVPLPDESFVGHGLQEGEVGVPGRRVVFERPRWRMLRAEATLPRPLPVVRSRPAQQVERSWDAPRTTVCELFPGAEARLTRRTSRDRFDDPPTIALALRPPDASGRRWAQPHRGLAFAQLEPFVEENAHWWRNRAFKSRLDDPVQVVAACPGEACRADLGDVVGFRAQVPGGASVELAHGAAWAAARYVESSVDSSVTPPLDKLRAALRVLLGAGFGCAPVVVEWVETPGGLRASTAFDRPWPTVSRYDQRVDFWVDGDGVSMVLAKRYRIVGAGGWSHVAPDAWLEAMTELRSPDP